jgi:hypothetical protein
MTSDYLVYIGSLNNHTSTFAHLLIEGAKFEGHAVIGGLLSSTREWYDEHRNASRVLALVWDAVEQQVNWGLVENLVNCESIRRITTWTPCELHNTQEFSTTTMVWNKNVDSSNSCVINRHGERHGELQFPSHEVWAFVQPQITKKLYWTIISILLSFVKERH